MIQGGEDLERRTLFRVWVRDRGEDPITEGGENGIGGIIMGGAGQPLPGKLPL